MKYCNLANIRSTSMFLFLTLAYASVSILRYKRSIEPYHFAHENTEVSYEVSSILAVHDLSRIICYAMV